MASEKPRNTIKESCPNCGHTKSKNDTECTKCGIIYEKYEKIQNRKNEEKEKHKNESQLKSKKLEEEKQKKEEIMEKTNPNKRVCALLIDYFLLIMTALLICYLLKIDSKNPIIQLINFILLMFRDSYKGISPGKYIVGIQVVNINDIPISFLGSIKRNIVLFWSITFHIFLVTPSKLLMIVGWISGIIIIIEYIRIAYTKSGRRFGDLIGKTKVIDLKPARPGWAYLLLSLLIIIVSVVLIKLLAPVAMF